MQQHISLIPDVGLKIGKSLSYQRIGRYLPAAGGDYPMATRLYLYNIKLCQEFYAPMNMAEVVFRNAISDALTHKYGKDWHVKTGKFYRNLNKVGKRQIDEAIKKESSARGGVTVHRVITNLSLGFWVRMLRASKGPNLLRVVDIKHAFPNLPTNFVKKDLYARAKSFRDFRNKIFHHNAIFDRGPVAEFNNMKELVRWTCEDSLWLMGQMSNPIQVIAQKPTI